LRGPPHKGGLPRPTGRGFVPDKLSQSCVSHARLSIIDLTTGDQPIASEDERTRIIVNGEFYGFEQVANDQILMILVSVCVLQERFGLSA
jgi:asparagine synthetase B (glutamine-hydrolysing)